MDTIKQRAKRGAKTREVIAALVAGRHLSLYNQAEFELAEMHTVFCKIRKAVEAGRIKGYTMKDRWAEKDGIRYKVYWFERDED